MREHLHMDEDWTDNSVNLRFIDPNDYNLICTRTTTIRESWNLKRTTYQIKYGNTNSFELLKSLQPE